MDERAAYCFGEFLSLMGIKENQHTSETPARYAKAFHELTTPEEFNFTCFESDSDEMVVVQDIPFYTFCAHHVLPFHGRAHVAYIPQGRICGLSKLARVVEYYSRGLNVQEELTTNIADRIEEELNPLGVGVIMKAEHLCMTMRGVEAAGTLTTTSAMRGVFADHERTAKAEFMQIIRG